ncbi:MAG: thiamine pyrophosphate-dependent enzyme [Candidatus Thermoplasmatota archaeon]|nr:thiamine pyrophosphate-dependent enzyme [Candidatus Thermoplasmatota archaeon]MCL5983664.1 thiamine pyrophosphate-dependent enzyme [Candidatus Thermoplasmatota archaeon]
MADSSASIPRASTGPALPVIGKSDTKPTWCPGCGDFSVLAAVEMALKRLQVPSHNVAVVSGIGCSSNLPHFLSSYGFHAIHGRALPVAEGIRWANHGLTVIATGGDGDGFGIGAGHFVHTMRRNVDLTYVTMDNQIYGLTTGQASPTSMMGQKTKSTPNGVIERPVDPIALALASGATYVARGFSGDVKHLADLIANGIQHRGFSFVDVFSPCVTYNKLNTFDFFRQRVYKLETSGHDPTNIGLAFQRAIEWGEKIPIGLFYKVDHPTYEDLEEVLSAGPLAHQNAGLVGREKLLDEFA